MIKKIIRFFLILFIILIVIFFFVVGKMVDRSYNSIDQIDDYPISSKAKSLHESILVCDLHADNLLWDRDILVENGYGCVDIPKLIRGNYAIQVFDAVIKTPENLNYEANSASTDNIRMLAMANRWPIKTWFSLYERAIYQSDLLQKAANSSASLEFIKSSDELNFFLSLRKSNSYIVAGLLSIEGLHALEGKIENVDNLFEAGYRIMGLVHFFDNEVGGSSTGINKSGLTDFGRRALLKMESKNIIIDLAHASPDLINEVLDIATRPIIVSHTGVKGIYNSPRNLSDEEIKRIAENGGLIGVGFWKTAAGDIHPSAIAKSVRYIADLVGVKHVGLGSDFDGAVVTGFNSGNIIYVTEALIQEGFSDEEIKQIMGGNQIRFLIENLPTR